MTTFEFILIIYYKCFIVHGFSSEMENNFNFQIPIIEFCNLQNDVLLTILENDHGIVYWFDLVT